MKEKIKDFIYKIENKETKYIIDEWESLKEIEKEEIREYFLTKNCEEIKKYISLINEYLAKDIFYQEESDTNDDKIIEINGVMYSSKEIRDECLMNINFVSVLIEYLKKCDKNIKETFMEDIKKIDNYFYCAIDNVLSTDLKIDKKHFSSFNYFNTKAKILRQYKNTLKSEKFSRAEIISLLSIESRIFTPFFIDENNIL